MGGSVKKPVEKVKKETKRIVTGEAVTSGGASIVDDVLEDALGFRPVETVTLGGSKIAGDIGRKLIDEPKKEREEAKNLAAEQAAAQEEARQEIETQEEQTAAEEVATKKFETAKRKQRRRTSRARGRRSTILTQSLGEIGGATSEGRKTLLGL